MNLKQLSANPKRSNEHRVARFRLNGTSLSKYWQEYIKKRIEYNGECWDWTGTISSSYGHASVKRHPVKAHRLSFWAFKGEPLNQNFILHTCNNKKCVNPEHLKEGTIRENILDAIRDGLVKPIPLEKSTKKGSAHGRAKITEKDVLKIRSMAKYKIPYKKISEIFKVSESHICNIVRPNGNWRHI